MRALVVCLCAEWCSSCREYRATFDTLAAQFAGSAAFAWIDVEDEGDALDDPDIESFPTLLITDARGLRFLGPVTPQSGTAERLVRSALEGDRIEADATGLADRVRAVVAARSP